METDFSNAILCSDGKERVFHFARINSVAIYFHVSVVDDGGRLITGTLARDESGHWKLHEQELPAWFKKAEHELGDTIEIKAGRRI
jgi:hypothetical protein